MSYKLDKPYNDTQRADFVCLHQGLTSKETDTALYFMEDNEMWSEELQEPVINPNYEQEQAQKEATEFANNFFNTSLGYIRRKVTMKTGEVRDFLFDIKPTLKTGAPIITYNADKTQNTGVLVTDEFLTECDNQIYVDFYGVSPLDT